MTIARKMGWALRSNRRMMSAYERSLDGITDSGGSIAAASRIVPGTTRYSFILLVIHLYSLGFAASLCEELYLRP